MFDVPALEVDAFGEGEVITTRDLPETGHTWLSGKDDVAATVHPFFLDGQVGSRTDEIHFATNHVNQLWELVKAPATQKLTYGSNSWIFAQLVKDVKFGLQDRIGLQDVVQSIFCVHIHAAELEDVEQFSVKPEAPLSE